MQRSVIATGECDASDSLVRADEPLAGLQHACGGTLPGTLAIPEMLSLVRDARACGSPVLRTIQAQDRTSTIAAEVQATPEQGRCVLAIVAWQVSPLLEDEQERYRSEVERALASIEAEPSLDDTIDGLVRHLGTLLQAPADRIIAQARGIGAQLAGPLPEAYAAYASDMAAAAGHLVSVADEFAVTGDANDPATDRAGPVELGEIGRRAASLLSALAAERGMTIARPPAEPPVTASARAGQVLQIMLNLVGNALRYAPAGSTVRIAAETHADRAVLTVSDEGPGLDADQQARIFEPFERLGRAGGEGSGLGLYIARRLARSMGGELDLAGEGARGTCFTLILPAGRAADVPDCGLV